MTHNSHAPRAHETPLDPFDENDSAVPGEDEPGLAESLRGFFVGTGRALPRLVSRQWWWVTLLALLGVAGLARLGFWQLDRLEQRRAFNTMVAERYNMPPWDLVVDGLPDDLTELEWRRVEAAGVWEYEQQMILTNQAGSNGEPGVRLVTPLLLENGKAVLVSRGWAPVDEAVEEKWPALQEVEGLPIVGLIQQSQTIEETPAPQGFQRDWYRVDVPAMSTQMPWPLMSAFLMQLPEAGRRYDALPMRDEPPVLDEGSHLSYAIQWFMFAFILAFGTVQYVRWHDEHTARLRAERDAGLQQAVSAFPPSAPAAPALPPNEPPTGSLD